MVIYGVLAQVSVGDLFLAGIVPGVVIGLLLMLTVYVLVVTRRVHAPVQPRASATRIAPDLLRRDSAADGADHPHGRGC